MSGTKQILHSWRHVHAREEQPDRHPFPLSGFVSVFVTIIAALVLIPFRLSKNRKIIGIQALGFVIGPAIQAAVTPIGSGSAYEQGTLR